MYPFKIFSLITIFAFSCVLQASDKPVRKKRKINTKLISQHNELNEKIQTVIHIQGLRYLIRDFLFDETAIPTELENLSVAIKNKNFSEYVKSRDQLNIYDYFTFFEQNRSLQNYRDENGNSFLHLSIQPSVRFTNYEIKKLQNQNAPLIIQSLIAAGCDVDARNDQGETALHNAITYHTTHSLELLQNAGADSNIPDNDGNTPILAAAKSKHWTMVEQLQASCTDINRKNNKGNSLILYAFMQNNLEEIQSLQNLNADINTKNNKGETPMHFAAANLNIKGIKIAKKAGVDINGKNIYNNTPIFLLIRNLNNDHNRKYLDPNIRTTLETLVFLGANLNLTNEDNEKALSRVPRYTDLYNTLSDLGAK